MFAFDECECNGFKSNDGSKLLWANFWWWSIMNQIRISDEAMNCDFFLSWLLNVIVHLNWILWLHQISTIYTMLIAHIISSFKAKTSFHVLRCLLLICYDNRFHPKKKSFQMHPTRATKACEMLLSATSSRRWRKEEKKLIITWTSAPSIKKKIKESTKYTYIYNYNSTYHFVKVIAMILLFTTWTNTVCVWFFRFPFFFSFRWYLFLCFGNVMFKWCEYVVSYYESHNLCEDKKTSANFNLTTTIAITIRMIEMWMWDAVEINLMDRRNFLFFSFKKRENKMNASFFALRNGRRRKRRTRFNLFELNYVIIVWDCCLEPKHTYPCQGFLR